ncbi:hypothetical protein DL93DRAFT_2081627 [Clavulina sp. PMI_390]|nr:hypothetical protein DL93DRAFT_2081627 [Clavulina sp. PMI_390]
MDDQSSTTTLPQVKAGPLWLQKINSDIIFSITTWLNPLSILSLSLTCRYLRYTVRDDRLIWSHAMRHTAAEHCIAPHSLDDLSINDLRLFSTRPARLMKYLKNPENSPQVKITKCTLDFGPLLAAPSSGNTKLTPELEYLAADILQGGRWIISGAINHTTQTTYICCWDRLGFISEDIPLQPVATVTWEGFRPKKPRRGANWLHAQLGENRSVVLAIPVHRWESTWSISYELLRIQWTPNEHVPTIESAARLAQADYHALDNDTSDYRLEGPYLILESMEGIVIWDWQHDEIGRADDEGHEWSC